LLRSTLPVTGTGVVDWIITNMVVLDVVEGGPRIVECGPVMTEAKIRERT
jgi:acyl CoA:acetate/3-ketoacid CoA transferase beta subunit